MSILLLFSLLYLAARGIIGSDIVPLNDLHGFSSVVLLCQSSVVFMHAAKERKVL